MVPTDHDIPFSRTFEVHFKGVFKDFSLFFQTSIREKMINIGLFKLETYKDHLILSSPEKMVEKGGGIWVYVFNFFILFAALWL